MEIKSWNTNLRKAKSSKKDEFYTQITDIERELWHYKEHFKWKIIFCNCDDPEESNFWKYFELNFEYLWIKKLISTHYEVEKPSYKLEIIWDRNHDGKINKLDIIKTPLQQNWDFRSTECIEILEEADIIVTNPPFSLFREYVTQLFEYNKKFIIVWHQNAITYKEIFKLLKENKIWLGYGFKWWAWHFINKYYEDYASAGNHKEWMIRVSWVNWFTNLEIKKRHEDLILYKTYNESEYPKYDNYDAINVDITKNIPIDYIGAMWVPITFMDKYNPDQFEIIGQWQGNLYRELTKKWLNKDFVENYYKTGWTGSIKEDHPVLGYYDKNGKAIIPYMRIIIKNKKLNS